MKLGDLVKVKSGIINASGVPFGGYVGTLSDNSNPRRGLYLVEYSISQNKNREVLTNVNGRNMKYTNKGKTYLNRYFSLDELVQARVRNSALARKLYPEHKEDGKWLNLK